MGSLPILRATGLQTSHNPFSGVSPGALQIARNVVIFSNGVVEPRRGFKQLSYTYSAPNTQVSNSGGFFGESLVVHLDSNSLAYDTGSAITAYSGTFEPVDDTLLRPKFVEAKEALYVNTADGVYTTQSVSDEPVLAGLPAPIPNYGDSTLAFSGTLQPTNSQMSFRAVFGYYDAAGREILGPPSERVVLTNTSGGTMDPSMQFNGYHSLPGSHFMRVYRTNYSASSTTDPGDEHFLGVEKTLDEWQAASGLLGNPLQIDLQTFYPTLGDVPLYTNPRTGDSILSSNDAPPIAKDLSWFGGRLWCSNTAGKHSVEIEILGIGSPDGVQAGDTITIGEETFTAVTGTAVDGEFEISTGGTASENIIASAKGLCDAINHAAEGGFDGFNVVPPDRTYRAIYLSASGTGTYGRIRIEGDTLATEGFSVTASRSESWNPQLPTSGETFSSSRNAQLNAEFYSKPDQPEAVPLTNYLLIGASNKQVLRSVPLRDKRFVFKEDGIFTVAGDEPFTVDLLDATTKLLAPDTAQVLNNQILALTNQGVVAVSDAGVQVLSRGIEDELLPFLNASQRSTVKRTAFAVAHETDRVYELWLPGPGASDSRVCNTAFVYNTMTQSWTVWDGSERSWGAVSPTDVRYYGGTSGKILKERRDFATSDYADEYLSVTVTGCDDTTLTLSSTSGITVGDALVFTKSGTIQSVTVNEVTSSTVLEVSEPILTDLQSGATVVCDIAFQSEVRWLPVAYDHPGSLKRFSEGTLHFARGTAFYNGYAVYSTEMATGTSTETVAQSTTGWGSQAWGSSQWGDSLTGFNMRHTIPLEKQRAASLSPGFRLREARKGWKMLGLTLETSETSPRNSR